MSKRLSITRAQRDADFRTVRAEQDAAYRSALGVLDGSPLPNKLGSGSSAGSARGGRGAAQRGKGRNS